MKIQKFFLGIFFVFAFAITAGTTCPDGSSQGKQLDHWDPLNRPVSICPHIDGLTWCCYDPCDVE